MKLHAMGLLSAQSGTGSLGLGALGPLGGHKRRRRPLSRCRGNQATRRAPHRRLQFTAGGDLLGSKPHPEALLVLYLETQQVLDAIAPGLSPSETTPADPYWQRTVRVFADPNGFQLVLTLQASRAN